MLSLFLEGAVAQGAICHIPEHRGVRQAAEPDPQRVRGDQHPAAASGQAAVPEDGASFSGHGADSATLATAGVHAQQVAAQQGEKHSCCLCLFSASR